MTTRTTGPIAGYDWVWAGVQLLGRRPGLMYRAAAFVLGLSLLPSLITLPLQYALPRTTTVTMGILVFSVLCGLALAPAQGGFLQVVRAVVNDRPARARDVFAPYGRADQAWPLVGFAAVMLLVSGAVVLAVFFATDFRFWSPAWQAAFDAQMQARPTQALPPGFGNLIVALAVAMPPVMAMYAIGYGQVALAGRGVGAATRDGLVGALRNLHVLWILLVGGTLMALVVALILGLGAVIVGFLAALGGKAVMFAVLGVFYIALMLTSNVIMFGFMYALWRDVCGVQDGGAPAGEAAPGTSVAA